MEVEASMAAAGLCCVGACALALYLYHVLWVAPERVRAALRGQGIGGPRPSFPYGNRDEMRQAAAAAFQRRGGIVHDYRPALFPHYERWRKEYERFDLIHSVILFLSSGRRPQATRRCCLWSSSPSRGK
ncbi:hypothetical protein C2845_PM04G34130 [Panicum miliaceum]|uniref:Uncharacterized protein n=1 Tax=Panicum miliaceum TaxID=4540 RepID=A0A3L6QUA8_PANMI|nr:hypothetical protein C2845_PM04G34130 [Panicum miliaceum]